MTDQTFPATAQARRRTSRRSRVAALCAVALISVSGSLLMELGGAGRLGVPFSVSWMFGPPGGVSVQ